MSLRKPFTLYLTEKKVNDAVMNQCIDVLEQDVVPKMQFRASYIPPYTDSSLIRTFQYRSAYRPFRDEPKKQKIAVVYLSEWIGHEREEHLEKFVKFLHDYDSFFHFSYYFVAEGVTKKEARAMYDLLRTYIGEGRVVESKIKNKREMEGEP